MSSQILTIIYVVLALIAGYVFGLLDKWVTGNLRKKPADPAPPIGASPSIGASPQKVVEVVHAAHESNLPGERTVLKVTRDEGQQWHVELEGTRIEKPEEISPDERQRMVNVVMQVRPWLEGKALPGVQGQSNLAKSGEVKEAVPLPVPQPAQQQPKSEVVNVPAAGQVPAAAARQDNLKISPARGFSEMITKDVKAALPKKPTSIVGMIDEVLQAKLPATAYKDAGIRLEDGVMGEVIVVVGSQSFKGLDSVPDPEIRNLIRVAIAEWEKK